MATGDNATAAYRAVYGTGKNADVFGSRLMGNDGICARVGELQAGSATAATLTMQQRREIACAIARDTTARASDRLAAILADARLAGEVKGDSVTVSATASANGYGLTDERRAFLMAKVQRAIEQRKAQMQEDAARLASNGVN